MAKFSFLPTEKKFFDLFEQASKNLLETSHQLVEFYEKYDNRTHRLENFKKAKHRGEEISQEITTLLVTTLIVPIDSEDIEKITHCIDDILDAMEGSAARMVIFKIEKPKEHAKTLAKLTNNAIEELENALKNLRSKKTYPQVRENIKKIHEIKQNASSVFTESLHEIVENHDDMFNFLRWKVVFEEQKRAIDKVKELANTLFSIVIKNA